MHDRCLMCGDETGEIRPGYCNTHGHLVSLAARKVLFFSEKETNEKEDCVFPGCLHTATPDHILCFDHLAQREAKKPLSPLDPVVFFPRETKPSGTNKAKKAKKTETPGTHLLRVRIRLPMMNHLRDMAEEESLKCDETVTVSDIVRSACYNHLLLHQSIRQLELIPPDSIGGDLLIIQTNPMLLSSH